MITEEVFDYDSKDLLAWIGGALGIFVGYSFFDLFVDIFYVYRFIFYHPDKISKWLSSFANDKAGSLGIPQ